MSSFESDICSPPDREKLVSRIMYDNEQVAEINQEISTVRVELYGRQSGEPWILPYEEFLDVLKHAKSGLVGPMNRRVLRHILKREGFDLRRIGFCGGCADNTFYIEHDGEKWRYYYCERGTRFNEQRFDSEAGACDHLLDTLRSLPEPQMRRRQRRSPFRRSIFSFFV